MNPIPRICKACGWIQFGVTRVQAEDDVTSFNAYFDGLSSEKQQDLYRGKRATIQTYERCFNCKQTHRQFRDATLTEIKRCAGRTVQPIIVEEPCP